MGAFVERKEITTIKRSEDIRARILETLKDVTDVQAIDVDDGLSLLNELKGAQDDAEILADADPLHRHHPKKVPGGRVRIRILSHSNDLLINLSHSNDLPKIPLSLPHPPL